MVQLGIRVDDKLRDEATKVFQSLGLDMTTAVRMFLTQAVITKSIPFDIKLTNPMRYDENGDYITEERLEEAKKFISMYDEEHAIDFDIKNPEHVSAFFDDED